MNSPIIFPPCGPAPLDSITPVEAISLLAGAGSEDPFDEKAYLKSDGTAADFESAKERLFIFLMSGELTGFIPDEDGKSWRVSRDWVLLHRRHFETIENGRTTIETYYANIPDTIERRNGRNIIPQRLRGRPWFVSEASLKELLPKPAPQHFEKSRLPDSKLRTWWDEIVQRGADRCSSEADLMSALRDAFPEHYVARERLRELRGPQKAGPKQSRGKSSAS